MDGRLQQPRHCCRVISSSGRLHPQCSTCTSNPGPRNSLKRTSSAVAYRSSNGTHPHVRLDARYLLPRHAKPNRYNTPACLATAAGNLGLEGQAAKCVADIDPGVYLDPSLNPEPFVGPIKVAHIPGKGRGLVTTQPLLPGQLLLVTPPLALIEGDLGDIPDHDELQEVMTSSGAMYTPWQAAWLAALVSSVNGKGINSSSSDGGSGGAGSEDAWDVRAAADGAAVEVPDMMPPEGYCNWYGEDIAAAGAAAAAAADRVPYEGLGLSEERLWAAIVLNCYGEAFQDLPATLCSGATISSQLGLWGPFALLNHSCCPNAVNYTLRDSMVVRAAAALPPGTELCINYLGRGALRPLSQRQLELEACYGFKCSCPRCQLEAEVAGSPAASGSTVGQLLDSIQYSICTYEAQLQTLTNCRTSGEAEEASSVAEHQQLPQGGELRQLIAEMEAQWRQLQAAFSSINSSSASDGSSGSGTSSSNSSSAASALALSEAEAGVFDLLGLLQEGLAAAGQPDRHVLHAMLRVCEVVSPGSDLHVFHALRWASLTQQARGEDSDESTAAFARLVNALRLRYGQGAAAQPLLSRMVEAASEAAAMVAF